MAISPLDAAALVFSESLISLMAHTIRGVTNHFEREKIELTVLVAADVREQIQLRAPKKGATSLLMTNYVSGSDGDTRNRLLAKIYIHKDANKHLARVCIAHEVFHLLLELDAYKSGGRKEWPVSVKADKLTEDQCNQFAWQLCKNHDDFNRREDLRKKHIFFPQHTFDKPFNMDNTAWYLDWPADISLDSNHPFYKHDPIIPAEKPLPL